MGKKLTLDVLKYYEIRELGHFKDQLNKILKDIKKEGRSLTCPSWNCVTCKTLFPKIALPKTSFYKYYHESSTDGCPCTKYSSKHLIKRLNEILENWPKKDIK